MRKHSSHKTLEREGMVADELIKYYTKCNRCYESVFFADFHKKSHGYFYYDDFPTYGKKKITCGGCSGETLFIRKTRGFIFYEIVKT